MGGGGRVAASVLSMLLLVLASATAAADTAYVANEATVTISVINTNTRMITDTIGLGSDPAIPDTPQPNGPFNGEAQHHNPFYNGHVDPHGLWLTPDERILLVAARISGTVVAIDTMTNSVLGYAPVGREPHLATVRPSSTEAWVAVRGESYVEILSLDPGLLFDPSVRRTDRMPSLGKVDTPLGPSMVSFTSDGQFAFVAAGKEATVVKIDADARTIVASQTVAAPFTPFGLVTPDDQELYLVHKGAGKLSILRTSDLAVLAVLDIGPRANHVFFVGPFAYITIGGPAPSQVQPDPEGKIVIVDRATRSIVHELTGPAFTGDPHAIWATANQRRLLVGHERGNRVTFIDTRNVNNPFDDLVDGVATDPFMKRIIDIVIRR